MELKDLFGDNLPKVLAMFGMTECELTLAMIESRRLIEATLQTQLQPRCIQ